MSFTEAFGLSCSSFSGVFFLRTFSLHRMEVSECASVCFVNRVPFQLHAVSFPTRPSWFLSSCLPTSSNLNKFVSRNRHDLDREALASAYTVIHKLAAGLKMPITERPHKQLGSVDLYRPRPATLPRRRPGPGPPPLTCGRAEGVMCQMRMPTSTGLIILHCN